MHRKLILLGSFIVALCLLNNISLANAADTWFYEDDNGAQYYDREKIGASSWIGGRVIKVDATGNSIALRYRFDYWDKVPYSITYDDQQQASIEKGYLYGDGIPNPSAKILYETYLKK